MESPLIEAFDKELSWTYKDDQYRVRDMMQCTDKEES